ncbi:MAG: hypothetical protein E7607_06925 [Ruminococcaceae bacterium]|nr:hypothetical protein [Oscillospiraceae bacterium]
MEKEINFGFLWRCLKKCWIFVLLAAILSAALAGLVASLLPKKYSSSVNFYIKNTNTELDYVSSQYIDVSDQLINDYVELIKSDVVLDQIKETYLVPNNSKAKEMSNDTLRDMISASSKERTSHFTIKITHTDSKVAHEVACAIKEVAPGAITNIVKDSSRTTQSYASGIATTIMEMKKNPENYEVIISGGNNKELLQEQIEALLKDNKQGLDFEIAQPCFESTNTPVLDKSADSPNVVRIALLVSIATAAIVYIIFFVIGLSQANITTEEDIKKHINIPVIGIIPSWEVSKQAKNAK